MDLARKCDFTYLPSLAHLVFNRIFYVFGETLSLRNLCVDTTHLFVFTVQLIN